MESEIVKTTHKELDTTQANREIKDGVFKLLFEIPENAADLYYALTGIECRPDEIQIITISTIISGNLKNDLAFVVRGKALVVGEHQSTPNDNMPVRMLMYLGQLYEKWFKMMGEDKLLYGTKLTKIPRPKFVVFYNGVAKRPEKEILKLSNAFEDVSSGSSEDKDLGFLELQVPVYNINKGMNTELLRKGEKLRQYSEFVAKLREFQSTFDDFESAVKETVNHCIANDILAEFLKEMGGKIVSVLFAEYDEVKARKVFREENLEDFTTAIRMLRHNRPIEEVVEETGLDEATVKQLMSELFAGNEVRL